MTQTVTLSHQDYINALDRAHEAGFERAMGLMAVDSHARQVVTHEARFNAIAQWHDKPLDYWYRSLAEEFLELTLALDGQHEHPPELELKQMGAICIGFMRQIDRLAGRL